MRAMAKSTRLAIVEQSLIDILERLDELQTTPQVRELRAKARGYERAVMAWKARPPTNDQRTTMLKLVLDLNVEVMQFSRTSDSKIQVKQGA